MNQQSKPTISNKVVPFTGEFYPQPEPSPATSTAPYLIMVAAALLGGLALGAIATYQRTDQVQLRDLKAQSEQLEQVKTQVCRN